MINTIIIQPPLVQLNTPYPSGAYLLSFFKSEYEKRDINGNVKWFDLSNDFFHSVFCKAGLEKIFERTSKKALALAENYERQNDENTAFQLRRFVCQSGAWTDWIDMIIAIVCSSNSKLSGREFVHAFIRGAHVPRGNRMEQFLQSLNRDVSADDSQILASLALADLQDYISLVYDNNFSLIRYAEHLASSTAKFSDAEKGLLSPALEDFYKPLILEKIMPYKNEPALIGISVPFPGCFEAALYTAKIIRQENFKNCLIAFGGGYVNTELREIEEQKIFDYCDFLSYDKGYGSFIELFDLIEKSAAILFKKEDAENPVLLNSLLDGIQLYNTAYRFDRKIIQPKSQNEDSCRKMILKEREIVHKIFPDYSSIDFSKYPRLADDTNSMHRIWNDGAWLKAYLAYGCYWHRCSFCDTTLDYVKDYCVTDVESLYDSLYTQAEKTGVYGIHFVDEACPPVALEKFALKNLSCKNFSETKIPLTFWGNIRFEKTFSRDLADLLAAGGMTAVSAGIEIATDTGLDSVNKGTDIENIVSSCCALKEAGILIHSYMIFGFWNQSEQDLINSMETVRQLFAAGLLDSAFWHKFTLTLHSTVYKDFQNGKYSELKIIPPDKNQFARNDLHYEGEEKSQKYSEPLNTALELWMHGKKLNKSVESFFNFKMPSPSISKDFVNSLIQKYEAKRENDFNAIPKPDEKFVWLAGVPLILDCQKKYSELCWNYMGEMFYEKITESLAQKVASFLPEIDARKFDGSKKFTAETIISFLGHPLFQTLRGKGLCRLL